MNIEEITTANNWKAGDVLIIPIPGTIYQMEVSVTKSYVYFDDNKQLVFSEYPTGLELVCVVLEPMLSSIGLVFKPVYLTRFWEDEEFINFMINMKKEMGAEVVGDW